MTTRKRKPASRSGTTQSYATRAEGSAPIRSYTLPRATIAALEQEAARRGVTRSAVVTLAVDQLTGGASGLREAAALCRKLAGGCEPGPAAFAALGCAVACETRAREIEGGE